MEDIIEVLRRIAPLETFDMPTSEDERRKLLEDGANSRAGELGYMDCPICHNKGYVIKVEKNGLFCQKCDCMTQRRSMKRIERSGLKDMVSRYTFDTFKADTDAGKSVKEKAMLYANEKSGWFFICGNPGSGKTHICTAICGALIQEYDTRYMLWREAAPRLKALVNDAFSYEEEMGWLKEAKVLYIDDFLKGRITDADINLAFEIINARYNSTDKLTIISTERSIDAIADIDEAIGSRIYERCKRFCIKAPAVNRRYD